MLLNILNCLVGEECLFEDDIALVVFSLGSADEFLDERTDLLGPLDGGRDPLMSHQVRYQIPQHRLPVLWVAPELTDVLLVPHFIIINN